MQASQDFDYTATFFLYDSLNISRFSAVEKVSNDRFDLISFGFDLIPVIRAHVNPISVSTVEIEEKKLVVFPNPSKDYFEISENYTGLLQLYDLSGRLVKYWKANGQNRFEIEEMSQGVYQLILRDGENVHRGKLIKVKGE